VKPRLNDLVSTAKVVSIPLRTKFRGLTERELLVFEGPNGWSEWAAFTEYQDEEAATWLEAAIEWGYETIPEPVRKQVPVNAILPAVPADEVSKVLGRAGKFSTVKIKVADPKQTISDDLSRILEVRNLYPDVKLRLDANGGYTVQQALELIAELASNSIELEFFEQPVATIAELAELRVEIAKTRKSVKIAADESVRKSSDPLAVELAGAADLLVIKSAPLGGIRKALDIANSSNLEICASSAMQSSIGLAAELHFASCLPELNYDAGLGTGFLFGGDLTADRLIPENGILELRRPEINTSSLEILKAEDHRFDWWIARLERCSRILGLES
jgi:O-succinylbenzoate synthase